jgi:hypothetical protein
VGREMWFTYEGESYCQCTKYSGGQGAVSELQQGETRSAHCECNARQRRDGDRGNHHVTMVVLNREETEMR